MSDFRERCTRCGRNAPSALLEPGATVSAQVVEGWVAFESEDGDLIANVCPGCLTDQDHEQMWPDDLIRRELGLS